LSRIPSRGGDKPGFWAKITAATSVADNRWKYDWTEIEWTISAGVLAYSVPTDALTGPITITGVGETGWAWNSTEVDNTDDITGSGWEDQDLTLTDDTITIEAIKQIGVCQGGSDKLPIVWLSAIPLSDSNHLAYEFTGWNVPGFGI